MAKFVIFVFVVCNFGLGASLNSNLNCRRGIKINLGPSLGLRGGCTQDQLLPKDSNSAMLLLNKKYAPFYRPPIRRTLKSTVGLLLGMITLLPARMIMLSGLLLTCWVSCIVLRFGAKMKNGVIVSSTRRSLLRWIIKRISGLALFVCGIEVKESGMPSNTEAPKMVVCNHVSYIDVIWALSKFAPSFVAKGAVARSEAHGNSLPPHPAHPSKLKPRLRDSPQIQVPVPSDCSASHRGRQFRSSATSPRLCSASLSTAPAARRAPLQSPGARTVDAALPRASSPPPIPPPARP